MEWISVKERLPEFNKYVLIIQYGEKMKFFQTPCIGYLEAVDNDGNRFKSYGEYNTNLIYDASFWMELPEPPDMKHHNTKLTPEMIY